MPRFWVTILILHTSTAFIFYWLSAKRLKHERIGGYVGFKALEGLLELKEVEGLDLGRKVENALDLGRRMKDGLDFVGRGRNWILGGGW